MDLAYLETHIGDRKINNYLDLPNTVFGLGMGLLELASYKIKNNLRLINITIFKGAEDLSLIHISTVET